MLHLFETFNYTKLKLIWFTDSIENKLFLITVIACFFLCLLCLFFFSNFIIKIWKSLIRNISKKLENFLNLKIIVQISWLFCIFIILLVFNILGLIPKLVGVTIILFVPVFLAFWIFWVVNFFGFTSRLDGFLKKYYPTKLPHLISPGIIWIEFVSYMIRPVSLSARLFANMLAGHILVHIISNYGHIFFQKIYIIFFIIVVLFLSILNFMEYFVSCIQSILFISISSLYYKDNL